MYRAVVIIFIAVIFIIGCGQAPLNYNVKVENDDIMSRGIKVGDNCETCEYLYKGTPKVRDMKWEVNIADSFERGERMRISGTIFQKDGKTPAENVILYVYHTNSSGYYFPADTQTLARRHGHLRAWMKTGKDGRYCFHTIRPAAYPDSDIPQHVHPIIKEPGKLEYYIDEYQFDDDPKLTSALRINQQKRGGSGIIHLTKDDKGVWLVKEILYWD